MIIYLEPSSCALSSKNVNKVTLSCFNSYRDTFPYCDPQRLTYFYAVDCSAPECPWTTRHMREVFSIVDTSYLHLKFLQSFALLLFRYFVLHLHSLTVFLAKTIANHTNCLIFYQPFHLYKIISVFFSNLIYFFVSLLC